MIIRIVKMTFKKELVPVFLKNFNENKNQIRAFDGCDRLELLNDVDNNNVYFTYSYWKSTKDLEKYRQSDLFQSVWSKTKVLFEQKPEAWSVKREEKLD